jgi:hypothetical protein
MVVAADGLEQGQQVRPIVGRCLDNHVEMRMGTPVEYALAGLLQQGALAVLSGEVVDG